MRYLPKPPQRKLIDFLHDTPRANAFASPGTGKTAATLTALDDLALVDDVYPALVIGPMRVATSVWPVEVRKWDHLQHLTVSKLLGTAEQRRAALRTEADIYTIHYGLLKWLIHELGGAWPFPTVVCDESTRLKGHRCSLRQSKTGKWFMVTNGTVNAKSLMRQVMRPKRWINLSGTPAPNGLRDLWPQHFAVDYGATLGRSFNAFSLRWFRLKPGSDKQHDQIEPMPHAFDEITQRMAPTTLSIDARDYFQVSEPRVIDIRVSLPAQARKLYDAMHRKAQIELESLEKVTAVNAGAVTNKCLQLASGLVYRNREEGHAKNHHWIHDAKLEALRSLFEEMAGAPLLVAYHFTPDRDRILQAIPGAEALPTGDKQIEVEARWNAGEIPMLVVHPQSAGHGLNLQHGGHHVCIYSPNWNLEYYEQVIERVGPVRQAQAGYDRIVHVYRLIAEHTFDETVIARLSSKCSVQNAVLETFASE